MKSKFYWGEISEKEMHQVLAQAERDGYRSTLASLLYKHPELSNYLLSDVRIDWVFHCLTETGRDCCLDLGSGWGSISFPLAEFFREIVSLERVSPRLKFQQIRAKNERNQAIRFVDSDMLVLPFRDNQFDLIVANGELEWAGFLRSEKNPRTVQLGFLKEIERCLRPGGCLYLGIENRFGIQYWMGEKDHLGIPFTSILPRKISDLVVSILKDGTRYTTYTYSFMGYASLLKEAGFGPIEFYWNYPTYTYPRFAGKLNDGESYTFFFQHHLTSYHERMTFVKRLIALFGTKTPSQILGRICPIFWPSYLIFAWKGFKPYALEDAIAEKVGATSLARISGEQGEFSKICYVAITNGTPRSYSKLSRHCQSDYLEKEEALLGMYAGISSTKQLFGNFTVFHEKALAGRQCSYRDLRDHELAIRWLLEFQERTVSNLTGAEQEAERSELIGALSRIESTATIAHALARSYDELRDALANSGVPNCSEHGDFYPKSILISNSGEVLVLDWEFFNRCGNPLFDFSFFIIRAAAGSERDFSKNLAGSGSYSRSLSHLIRTYGSIKGLPTTAVLLGIPYTLMRCTVRHSVYSKTYSPMGSHYVRLLKMWNDEFRDYDFAWIKR